MNSPQAGPSKRSKMAQFKPKDKLRLGASFKPKPMEVKPSKRRQSEEPVIHGKLMQVFEFFSFGKYSSVTIGQDRESKEQII